MGGKYKPESRETYSNTVKREFDGVDGKKIASLTKNGGDIKFGPIQHFGDQKIHSALLFRPFFRRRTLFLVPEKTNQPQCPPPPWWAGVTFSCVLILPEEGTKPPTPIPRPSVKTRQSVEGEKPVGGLGSGTAAELRSHMREPQNGLLWCPGHSGP